MASARVPSLSLSINAISWCQIFHLVSGKEEDRVGDVGPASKQRRVLAHAHECVTESNIEVLRYFRTQRTSTFRTSEELSNHTMTSRVLRVIIMGPPGAGKGTISSRIASAFKLPHLSSGDLLRTHISQGTHIGREAKRYTSEGLLVPDQTMVSLILDSISGSELRWLLDGFPRTLPQAKALSENVGVDTVINLDVPDSTIIDRIKGRRVHLPSGRVYHDEYNPPKVARLDDHTGEELIQRPDDHPDTVRERLQHYNSQTRPVLDYYEKLNLLRSFTGTESDVLWPQIETFLHSEFSTE